MLYLDISPNSSSGSSSCQVVSSQQVLEFGYSSVPSFAAGIVRKLCCDRLDSLEEVVTIRFRVSRLGHS